MLQASMKSPNMETFKQQEVEDFYDIGEELGSAMDCSPPGSSVHGIHGGSDSKESACNAGDPGFTSGLGRSPGERNGYPLQYSCLENSILLDNLHDLSQGKLEIYISEGTHSTEEDINKQINDKERVAAAMENPSLREIVEQCVQEPD